MYHPSVDERLLDVEERRATVDKPLLRPEKDPSTTCWRRDEHGNLYRFLTPSERQQVEDAESRAD
jgi:hypothetical protein